MTPLHVVVGLRQSALPDTCAICSPPLVCVAKIGASIHRFTYKTSYCKYMLYLLQSNAHIFQLNLPMGLVVKIGLCIRFMGTLDTSKYCMGGI